MSTQNIKIVQSVSKNTIHIIEGRTSLPTSIQKPKEVASFTIIQQGPPGRTGDTGIAGPTGSSPPFYIIDGTTKYATTSSIAFLAPISSSLIPSGTTPVHSLGSLTNPWKDLFVATSSIKFVSNNTIISELRGIKDTIYIGNSYITTSSMGFQGDPIIIRNSGNDVSVKVTGSIETRINDRPGSVIRSGSVDVFKIDEKGRMILYNFVSDPGYIPGGLILSGSNLYIGV